MGLMVAHPVLTAIVGITAALGAAAIAYDHFNVSAQESAEALSDMKSEYDSNKSDIESLNSELETTKSRMDELQAKGHLTLTEQEELANLQAQNAELERTIALKEAQQKIDAKRMASQAEETYNKWTNHSPALENVHDYAEDSTYNKSKIEERYKSFYKFLDGTESVDQNRIEAIKYNATSPFWDKKTIVDFESSTLSSDSIKENADNINYQIAAYEALQKAQKDVSAELDNLAEKSKKATGGELEDITAQTNALQDYYSQLENTSLDVQGYMNEYANTISDAYTAYKEAESQGVITDSQKNQLKEMESFMTEYMKVVTNTAGNTESSINNLFAKSQFINLKDQLVDAAKSGEDVLSGVINKTPGLTNALKDAGIEAQQLSDYIMAIADPDSLKLDVIKEQLHDDFVPALKEVGAHAKKAKETIWDEFIGGKSDNEIEIFYKYVNSNDLDISDWNTDDLTANFEKAMGQVQESAKELTDTKIPTLSSLLSPDAEGNQSVLSKQVDTFQSNISSIQSALDSLKSGEGVDLTRLVQEFPELVGQTNNLDQALAKLKTKNISDIIGNISKEAKKEINGKKLTDSIEEMSNIQDFISNLFDNVDLSDVDLSDLKRSITTQLLGTANGAVERNMMSDYINGLFEGLEVKIDSDAATKAIDDFKTSIQSAIDTQNRVNTALEATNSATGLTAEHIDSITNAYKDLDGYDPETLFRETASGVRLNTQAMELLNAQLEANTKKDFLGKIADKKKELDAAIASGASDEMVSDLQNQLNTLQLLSAEYDGATSRFQKWVSATNSANAGDNFRNISGGMIESADELYKEGRYNNDDFRSAANYFSYDDLAGASMEEVVAAWGKASTARDRYFDGTKQGIDNFMYDMMNASKSEGFNWVEETEDGLMKFNTGADEAIAEYFGISKEAVQDLLKAASEYSDKIIVGDTSEVDNVNSSIEKLSESANTAKDKLKEMQDAGTISSKVDLNFDSAEMSVDDITAKITELENEKATIDVDTSEGQAAVQAIDNEISALNNQKIMLQIQSVVENGTSVDELLAMDNETLAATLNVDTTQVDEAREQLKSLQGETAETSLTVEIDKGQFDALVNNATNKDVSITATVEGTKDVQDLKTSVDELYPRNVKEEATVEGTGDVQDLKTSIDSLYPRTVQEKAIVSGTSQVQSLADSIDSLRSRTVYITTVKREIEGKKGNASGTLLSPAKASGTAYNVLNMKPISAFASGRVTLPKNETALINEERINGHSESIVRDGKWFLVPGGAHFENLKKGDLIFSAKQTDDLLKHGRTNSHARAYASGTLASGAISNAYSSGIWAFGNTGSGILGGTGYSTSSNKPSSSTSTTTKSNTTSYTQNTSAVKQNTDATETNTKAAKQSSQAFDWIRTALDKAKGKVEEISATITDFVSSAYKSSQLQKKITAIDKEIVANQSGYQAYLQKAEAVANRYEYEDDNENRQSLSIPEQYKNLVKNGQFAVEDMDTSTAYGKALAEAVQKYQEYYENAQDCRRAVQELRTEQYEAFQELVNIPTEKAEKKIEKLERKLQSLSSTQSASEVGGSTVALLQRTIDTDNPNIKQTADTLEKAEKNKEKTYKAYSSASKKATISQNDASSAYSVTRTSGTKLENKVKKETKQAASKLKKAVKDNTGISQNALDSLNNAVNNKDLISNSLIRKLPKSLQKSAKDYNKKLKQEQRVVGEVSFGFTGRMVSTKGMSKQTKALANKYNKDRKASNAAQKQADAAKKKVDKAKKKDEQAAKKLLSAQSAKANSDRASTSEQRTLSSIGSGKSTYYYQNKLLNQETKVYKEENKVRQQALKESTKNAEAAQKKQLKQQKDIQKRSASLLKSNNVRKSLNDAQEAALKAGKTVSTTGIADTSVLKKIQSYNEMVKEATRLNKQYSIALEAQSEAVANAAEAEAEYAQKLIENEQQKFENIQNYFSVQDDYKQSEIDKAIAERENAEANGVELSALSYEKEKKLKEEQLAVKKEEVGKLRKQLAIAEKNGVIKYTEEWYAMATEINRADTEVIQLDTDIRTLGDSIGNIELTKLESMGDLLSSIIRYLENLNSMNESAGKYANKSDYNKLISRYYEQFKNYREQADIDKENWKIAAKEGTYGGKTANEWLIQMYDDLSNAEEAMSNVYQNQKTVRELPLEQLTDEMENLKSVFEVIQGSADLKEAEGHYLNVADYQNQVSAMNEQIAKQDAINAQNKYLYEDAIARGAKADASEYFDAWKSGEASLIDMKVNVEKLNDSIRDNFVTAVQRAIDAIGDMRNVVESQINIKQSEGNKTVENNL